MIENVIIMGLDRRIDLFTDLEKQCVEKGWRTKIFISGDNTNKSLTYDNVDPNPCVPPEEWNWGRDLQSEHHYKAFLTHKKILKYAIRNNFDHFLLLEDDTSILPRFDNIWEKKYPEILSQEWDLIYLGCHFGNYDGDKYGPANLEIERKYKENNDNCYAMYIQRVGGLFATIINKSMYSTLLALPAIAPIDHQINQMRSQRLINSFCIVPVIAYPKTCFSECEQHMVFREEFDK